MRAPIALGGGKQDEGNAGAARHRLPDDQDPDAEDRGHGEPEQPARPTAKAGACAERIVTQRQASSQAAARIR